MPILTAEQLAYLRREMARSQSVVDYNKPVINAALQAIEDWFESRRAQISNAIDTATSPVVLTAAQKRLLVIAFLMQKAGRE